MKPVPLLFFLMALFVSSSLVSSGAHAASRLDFLFAELKASQNEARAREIENQIWLFWTHPPHPELASLMKQALAARRGYDFAGALAILDQVVARWPKYAEGWNQRATVHFMRQDYEKSLIDIAETLEHEPRHFGALAGRAVIRLKQLKPALALQNIRQAMTYHPFLRERALFPQLLRQQ